MAVENAVVRPQPTQEINIETRRYWHSEQIDYETTKERGIRGKQKNAGWDHRYLLRLLGVTVPPPATRPGATI